MPIFAESLASAEEALKKAAKLNPALDGAWNCLGQLFWKKGNLDGAKNCYQSVLKRGGAVHVDFP
jgi:Flp pilus assembly protein TadD